MTQITKTIAALGFALLLSGCTQRVGEFTLISTRDIDLSGHVDLSVEKSHRHMGEDCTFYFLGGYPVGAPPSLHVAVERALSAGNGNVIVNEVTSASHVWALLGTVHCIDVRGNVLSIPYKSMLDYTAKP